MKKSNIIAIVVAALVVGAIGFLALVAIIAVPNLSGVQKRSQVNVDIRTAEQIGKAIRVYSMENKLPNTMAEYNELDGIEAYIGQYEPMSMEDGEFYLVVEDGMIKIAIARDVEDVNDLTADIVDYDGKGAGWAYIEER